jgi:hypothetical protein
LGTRAYPHLQDSVVELQKQSPLVFVQMQFFAEPQLQPPLMYLREKAARSAQTQKRRIKGTKDRKKERGKAKEYKRTRS